MKLKASKHIRYGGKSLKAGEVFECKPADVRILLAIKHAETYVEPVARKTYATRVVFAEPVAPAAAEPAAEPAAEEVPAKRQYKRRDLTAEE